MKEFMKDWYHLYLKYLKGFTTRLGLKFVFLVFFSFFFGRKAFSYTFIFFYNLKNTQIYLSLSVLLTSQSINLALLPLLYVCFLFYSFLFLSLFPSLCVKIFNDESEFKFYQLCFTSFETMLTGTQKFKIVMSLC